LFVYDRDKGFAQELANHVDKNDSNTTDEYLTTFIVVFKNDDEYLVDENMYVL